MKNLFKNKTFTKIVGMCKDSEEILFTTIEGDIIKMYHEQDCCETVYLEDVNGKVEHLINEKIIDFKIKTKSIMDTDQCLSTLFTFYTFITKKGYVDLRWCGESNGYYSESVDYQFNDEEICLNIHDYDDLYEVEI